MLAESWKRFNPGWEFRLWTDQSAREFINDTPHSIDGYVFSPARDSVGFEVLNSGRNIPELAARWRSRNDIAGFNTDGFAKSYIRPQYRWVKLPAVGANEGLNVKQELVKS